MIGSTHSNGKSTTTARKSQRGLETINIPVVTLGRGTPAQLSYGNQIVSKEVIKEFVANKIKTGYQIVCLPMPPNESHSIIVEVSRLGVKVVDWGGEQNRRAKGTKWQNYTVFVNYLETKYGRVSYYPLDKSIYQIAYKRYKTNHGQGGCSEYVHNWINKYIGEEGKKAFVFTSDDFE